uniref:WD_REPEATS_REGION domain-containing protein n=1 Tax=Meloidogyne floridensis TaxID=298350 RepID=A0A915NYA0_9BILA
MKNRLNKLEKRQKFAELIDFWSSTGPQKMFSSKIKKSSINFNKNLSLKFDGIIEEMKQKEIKNAFLSNYFLFEALIYRFGNSNKHQKFWKISLKIYRELKRILNEDILGYFNKFNEKLKNSQFIYSPLKQTIRFFGAILLKRMFKLDKLRLICANSVDCSMGYVELGFFEANKQIIILANIYQKLGNYFYKSSKHWPNIDQLLKNELSTSFSNFTKEGNFLRREEAKQRNLIEFNFVENLSATELINFERVKMLVGNDAFAGANSGVLKGLRFANSTFVNFRPQNEKEDSIKGRAITAMSFADKEKSEVLIGRKNGQIDLFNTLSESINQLFNVNDNEESNSICGVECLIKSNKILTATNSGDLSIWNASGKCLSKWNAGDNLITMRLARGDSPTVFATGGKENELKVWNFEDQKCVFTAKNVRPDNLELRVPIWIKNCRFMDESGNCLATSTGNAQIRLYDIRVQRRPVLQETWLEEPINALSTCCRENHLLAGNSRGELGLFDFRLSSTSRLKSKYKGFSGSIKSIDASDNHPQFISCGVDRFVILHNLDTKQIFK